MTTTIVQVSLGLCAAAAISWQAHVWRLDGEKYFNSKNMDGGIIKQELISDGDRLEKVSLQHFETEGRIVEAELMGRAKSDADHKVAAAQSQKEILADPATRAQADAVRTLGGIGLSISGLERKKIQTTSDSERTELQTVIDYLSRAAAIAASEQSLGFGQFTLKDSGRACEPSIEQRAAVAAQKRRDIWSQPPEKFYRQQTRWQAIASTGGSLQDYGAPIPLGKYDYAIIDPSLVKSNQSGSGMLPNRFALDETETNGRRTVAETGKEAESGMLPNRFEVAEVQPKANRRKPAAHRPAGYGVTDLEELKRIPIAPTPAGGGERRLFPNRPPQDEPRSLFPDRRSGSGEKGADRQSNQNPAGHGVTDLEALRKADAPRPDKNIFETYRPANPFAEKKKVATQ